MSILNNDNISELKRIAIDTFHTLQNLPDNQKLQYIQKMGYESFFRLAQVDSSLAELSFSFLLQNLNVSLRKWFLMVLRMGQLHQEIQVDGEILKAPAPFEATNSLIGKLSVLYRQWPTLREKFIECIENSLGDDLKPVESQLKRILDNDLQVKLFPQAVKHNPMHPGKFWDIQQELTGLPNDVVGWLYKSACTLDQVVNELPQSHQVLLGRLITQYGREHLIHVLREKCRQLGLLDAITFVDQFIDTKCQSLSLNAKRWGYLTLLLGDFTESNIDNIRFPQGQDLSTCTYLEAMAEGCPTLARAIRGKIETLLGEAEVYNISGYISGFLNTSSNSLSDENRLWISLVLSTQTMPLSFSYMGPRIHENPTGDLIRGDATEPLLPVYLSMTHYSPAMALRVNNALTRKPQPDPVFEHRVNTLDLYVKHLVETQLNTLDENSLCWFYLTLTLNTHFSQPTALSPGYILHKPQGNFQTKVQHLLDAVYGNHDLIPYYLRGIEDKLSKDDFSNQKLELLVKLCKNFLMAKMNVLSVKAKSALYAHLTTFSPIAYEDLDQQSQNDIAKILTIISHHPPLFQLTLQRLAALPELSNQHPEAEFLSEMALRYGDLGELAFQAALTESGSMSLIPHLLKHLSARTREWLAKALSSGNIISTDLIRSHLGITNQRLSQELKAVPSLLVLALKWPSVRSRIIAACSQEPLEEKPVTQLTLDGLPLGDKGLIALSHGLKQHSSSLQMVSLNGTAISDPGINALATVIVDLTHLTHLQTLNNPMSFAAIREFIQIWNTSGASGKKEALFSFLLSFMTDNHVIGWLIARLTLALHSNALEQDGILPFPSIAHDERIGAIAKIVYRLALDNPDCRVQLLDTLAPRVENAEDVTQLVYAAVHSQQPEILFMAAQQVLSNVQDEKVFAWLKTALITGKLALPVLDMDRNKQMGLQITQLICLITNFTQEQRRFLLTLLGEEDRPSLADITEIKIRDYVIPATLKAALIQSIHCNPNTLKKLTLKSTYLYDGDMKLLFDALLNKTHLHALNLSENPLTVSSAQQVGDLIRLNHGIKRLKFSDCQAGEAGAIHIANAVSGSQLHTLVMQHHGKWEKETPIRTYGAAFFAQILSNRNCPLRHLDLSYNQLTDLGVLKIASGMQKGAKLRSIRLSHNHFGDQALLSMVPVLQKCDSLDSVEMDGHHAKPEVMHSLSSVFQQSENLKTLKLSPLVISNPSEVSEDEKPATPIMGSYQLELAEIADIGNHKNHTSGVTPLIERLSLTLEASQPLPLKRSASASTLGNLGEGLGKSAVLSFSQGMSKRWGSLTDIKSKGLSSTEKRKVK